MVHGFPGEGRNTASPLPRSRDIDMNLTTSPFKRSTGVALDRERNDRERIQSEHQSYRKPEKSITLIVSIT